MMARYYAGRPVQADAWLPPEGLVTAELDRATGQIADSATPSDRRYTEYFIPGTEPEPLRSIPWRLPLFGALTP
jgi:penicillin-binding protein 1A